MQTTPEPAVAGGTSTREALAWIFALVTAAVALAALGYHTRDADSRLHGEIAARISVASAARWIAPVWPPGWYMDGLYREHPAGIFWLPAAVARWGYPGGQAAYLVNAVYQVLTLVLLRRLVAALADGLEARTVGWLIQLIPIAFTFRIRANHEQALVLFMLLAIYGSERARERGAFFLVQLAGFLGLLLVKGVLAVFGPLACAWWLFCRRRGFAADRKAWIGLGLGLLAMLLAAWAYDRWYNAATGQPFWGFYLSRQLGAAAVAQSEAVLAQKAYNLVWYLGRVVWFAFPWSLTLLAASVAWGRSRESSDRSALAGALFAWGLSVLYVGCFSLSDRRADRYIFPVYYAVGAAGMVAALRASSRLRTLAERVDRMQPWATVAVWWLTLGAHLFAGRLGLPTIKIWTPES